MKLPWERAKEETDAISKQEVADWFVKVREETRQELLEAKKIKVVCRESRLSYTRRKKAGEG
jgi:hypothetical protein